MAIARGRRALAAIALLLVVTVVGGFALAWHPAIAPVAPDRAAFTPETIARGATLAAIGDCAVCHTATNGQPFAGGRPLPTPFGTVFVANITPDAETGVGRWSEKAFRRAMRDGIDRAGHHLYPALPYPHFTRATDEDIVALYAFLMTRAPVHATRPPNRLPFPLDIRAVLAGWNLLFLSPGPWHPDSAHDAEWNRGAYLVEAVGHCGACHTPHNPLGAEEASRRFDGGEADGWHAPALTNPSRPWRVDELAAYLRTGLSATHGIAAGPMQAVSGELARVPASDVQAIAVYLASLQQPATAMPAPRPATTTLTAGNAVFTGACGACHGEDAPMIRGGAPTLAVSAAVNAPTPNSAAQAILYGIPWREGQAAPFMPPFGASLSDAEIADLLRFIRGRYSREPAWSGVDDAIRRGRAVNGAEQGASPS